MTDSDDATGSTSAPEACESLKIFSCTCRMGPHLRILQESTLSLPMPPSYAALGHGKPHGHDMTAVQSWSQAAGTPSMGGGTGRKTGGDQPWLRSRKDRGA